MPPGKLHSRCIFPLAIDDSHDTVDHWEIVPLVGQNIRLD